MARDVALLLPGWGTSPRRFDRVRDELASRGVAVEDHPVQPDALLPVLARRARHHARSLGAHGTTVHLVGHSLGGLVAAWAATEDDELRLGSVTTVNSPWRGTWLAWTGTGPLARQLRYRSDTVQALRTRVARHLDEPCGPRWLALGVAADLGTPPTTSVAVGTRADRLERQVVAAAGHSASLLTSPVAEAVADHVTGRKAERGSDDRAA